MIVQYSGVNNVPNKNYLSYIDKTNIQIDLMEVPDSAFIEANKVVDVCMATILSRDKNKQLVRGGPDVQIQSASGEKGLISRKQLCSEFRHASGKKITMAYLKHDVQYVVYRQLEKTYKVLKLPSNCRGVIGTRVVKPNSFIVCQSDGNGALLKDTISVVSPKVFRKMFKIPMQEVIKRHMGGQGNSDLIPGSTKRKPTLKSSDLGKINTQTPITTNGGLRMGVGALNKQPVDVNSLPKANVTVSINKPNTQGSGVNRSAFRDKLMAQANSGNNGQSGQSGQTKYLYRATHRIVGMNNKNILGFVIQEIASGKSKQLTLDNVKLLCEQRKVENLMIVQKEGTNLKFLRGNGIRVESLPEVIM